MHAVNKASQQQQQKNAETSTPKELRRAKTIINILTARARKLGALVEDQNNSCVGSREANTNR